MRKVWPSAVVRADLLHELRGHAARRRRTSSASSPSYTKITSMSDAYDSSPPPKRPMPITANGSGGSSDASAASRHASASAVSSRPVASSARVAEEVARRDAQQLASLEAAQAVAPLLLVAAPLERVERVGRRARRGSPRRERVVVGERVDELGMAAQRVADAPGSSRGGGRCARRRPGRRGTVTASDADRAGPSARRRSCSRPRSGSGVSDSHSRISGSSCCITRERRVSPAVSSRTAARVRSTSVKPNAVRRSCGRLRRQRAGARERLEQRREEQPLVDRAHRAPGARGARPRSARARCAPGSSR